MRYVQRGAEKGRCALYSEEKNEVHILRKSKETQRWAENVLKDKWLCITEEIAYKKIKNKLY